MQIGIDYWKQFNNAVYVYCKDFEETGILETLGYKTTNTGTIIAQVIAKGNKLKNERKKDWLWAIILWWTL